MEIILEEIQKTFNIEIIEIVKQHIKRRIEPMPSKCGEPALRRLSNEVYFSYILKMKSKKDDGDKDYFLDLQKKGIFIDHYELTDRNMAIEGICILKNKKTDPATG